MTNLLPTQIPVPSEPIVDVRTGDMSRAWRYFLLNLFEGVNSALNAGDLAALAPVENPVEDGSGRFAALAPSQDLGPAPQAFTADAAPPDPAAAPQVFSVDAASPDDSAAASPFGFSFDPPPLDDHGALSGLGDDDHTQYALLAGRTTPQQMAFGTDSGANTGYLTSTAHATKGKYFLNAAGTITVDELNTQVGVGIASPLSGVHISGSRSSTSWSTTGLSMAVAAATLTDTSGTGTIASRTSVSFGVPTLASSNVVTVTDAATFYISGPPTAGSNMTLTRAWAMWVDNGNCRFDGLNGFNVAAPTASVHVQAPTSSASWTTGGVGLQVAGGTTTDTTGTGTIATRAHNSFAVPTLAATNVITVTRASTLYIAGAPAAGSNVTITTPLALQVAAGNTAFNGFNAFGNSTIVPAGVVHIGGSQSSASWTTDGINLRVGGAFTYTDTTGTGAIASRVLSSFSVGTLASTNAVTVANAATVYIAGAPAAGTNTTITTGWSLWVDAGNVRFDGTLNMGSNIVPQANDGASIGISGTAFSDVFLASGAVINFNAGNATITHSAGLLTSNVNIAVPDDAYAAGWNGSVNVPTKNAVYDQMELKAPIASPVFTGTVRLPGYTVATLPAAGTAGRMAYVTDALAPAWNTAIAGGGAVVCKVFDNGAAWVAG